ncbi:unnamed protein product [Ixodes pacificus]
MPAQRRTFIAPACALGRETPRLRREGNPGKPPLHCKN